MVSHKTLTSAQRRAPLVRNHLKLLGDSRSRSGRDALDLMSVI